MTDAAALNKQFACGDIVHIIGGEFPAVEINTPGFTGKMFLHGAHIVSWEPHKKGESHDVLFLSEKAVYTPGKAIRGGVPICFPWFGPNAENPKLPAHGFARTRMWTLEEVTANNGSVTVVMALHADDATRTLWPHEFELRHRATFSRRALAMELIVKNTGEKPFRFEEALHTYLQVADVRQATVKGLHGTEFLEKAGDGPRKIRQQRGNVHFKGEVDRVYGPAHRTCLVQDPVWNRQIKNIKKGSSTTVIWNPWIEKSAGFNDMAPNEYLKMLCVETANTGSQSIELAPNHVRIMRAQLGLRHRPNFQ